MVIAYVGLVPEQARRPLCPPPHTLNVQSSNKQYLTRIGYDDDDVVRAMGSAQYARAYIVIVGWWVKHLKFRPSFVE